MILERFSMLFLRFSRFFHVFSTVFMGFLAFLACIAGLGSVSPERLPARGGPRKVPPGMSEARSPEAKG